MKYKIMFGKWSTMSGFDKEVLVQYSRIGFIHIPYLFGGISIPLPIVRVRGL